DMRTGSVLGADSDHVIAAHDGDRAAVREPVDRHPNGRPLTPAEGRDDVVRDANPCGRLAGLQDRRSKSHVLLLAWSAAHSIIGAWPLRGGYVWSDHVVSSSESWSSSPSSRSRSRIASAAG